MERAVAIARLRKMFGKEFGYQFNPKAPTAEEREAAKQQRPALVAAKDAASKAMDARRVAVLAADAEYQRLTEEYKAARKAVDETNIIHSYKITVGTVNNLFFHVKAQGDSWEDIFKNLKK